MYIAEYTCPISQMISITPCYTLLREHLYGSIILRTTRFYLFTREEPIHIAGDTYLLGDNVIIIDENKNRAIYVCIYVCSFKFCNLADRNWIGLGTGRVYTIRAVRSL